MSQEVNPSGWLLGRWNQFFWINVKLHEVRFSLFWDTESISSLSPSGRPIRGALGIKTNYIVYILIIFKPQYQYFSLSRFHKVLNWLEKESHNLDQFWLFHYTSWSFFQQNYFSFWKRYFIGSTSTIISRYHASLGFFQLYRNRTNFWS